MLIWQSALQKAHEYSGVFPGATKKRSILKCLALWETDVYLSPISSGEAMFLVTDGVDNIPQPPRVHINYQLPAEVQLYYMAKALGYIVCRLDVAKQKSPFSFVERNGNRESTPLEPNDIFGTVFAYEFLAPEEDVKRLRDNGRTVSEIADNFGMSIMDMRRWMSMIAGFDRNRNAHGETQN